MYVCFVCFHLCKVTKLEVWNALYLLVLCLFSCMHKIIRVCLVNILTFICPSDPSASADLAVVMMQEGLAQIFLIGKRYINLPLHIYMFMRIRSSNNPFLLIWCTAGAKSWNFVYVSFVCYIYTWFNTWGLRVCGVGGSRKAFHWCSVILRYIHLLDYEVI